MTELLVINKTKECLNDVLGVSNRRSEELMEAASLAMWELNKPGLPSPTLGDILNAFTKAATNIQENALAIFVCCDFINNHYDYAYGDLDGE